MLTVTLAQRMADLLNDAETYSIMNAIRPYVGVFFAAFFVALITTPLMRMLALKNGIVDWPDLHRKNHIEPIAYLGGVGIFLGWLAGAGLCYMLNPTGEHSLHLGMLMSIVIGALAITLTGLFDDVYGFSPRVKLGGQLFAAAALATQNFGVELVHNAYGLTGLPTFPGSDTIIYILGTAAIAFFVVGGCNSLNLIDGLDGLAGGVTAIAAIGFLILAGIIASEAVEATTIANQALQAGSIDQLPTWIEPTQRSDALRIVMCLAILGAVLGYLPYNFNPASIFMGDAGSLLLGFLCISTILLFSQTGGNALKLVTASLIIFALPITDTSLAIFRRKMRGKPIMSPDNEHMHHLFRRSGLSVKKSVLAMYCIAIMFAVIGCGMVYLEWSLRFMLIVACVIYAFILVGSYKYGHKLALLDKIRKEEEKVTADNEQPVLAGATANNIES
ncbi:glycosyltransferase family 4 protein [Poriferisphaera sp. WC338]|uniref:glycosyltransferase family 4 protein n=1 Tax=Poriferisphaera sp. WC338 TaxID=3425129 RepID=UPI003D81BF8C